MRITRHGIVVVLAALGSVAAFSVIGQEEPLPTVTPRSGLSEVQLASVPLPYVALAIEPMIEPPTRTLADAARSNDFITFDALVKEAQKRGEPLGVFQTLHELWTYSITDPIGAFYGPEMHARFARAYPGYASYIDEYRIVDNRGNVFYPSSETRAFLLARALEGAPAPRVLIADTRPSQAPAPVREAARPVETRRTRKAAAPAQRTETAQAVVRQEPAPAPAAVTETPETLAAAVESTIAAPAPAIVAAPPPQPAPVIAEQPAAAQQTVAEAQTEQAQKNLGGRGLLLVIVGLIGVGLLAVILRTPGEPAVTP